MSDDWSRRSLSVRISPAEADELRNAIASYVVILGRPENDPVRQPLFPVGFTRGAQLLGETDRYTSEDLLDRKLRRVDLLDAQLEVTDGEVGIPLADVSVWQHVLREVVMVVDSPVAMRLSRELAARMDWGR